MLEKLKLEVYEANMALSRSGLVFGTFGNVSGIDRESGLVVIKPSGIEYSALRPEDMVVTDLNGNVVEGKYRPSSDTKTHVKIYSDMPSVGGICHTHSMYATSFAQSGRGISAYGTTHADYFDGEIPCTRRLTPKEIAGEYEYNTGAVIVETFKDRDPDSMRAVLVNSHGPFTWGKNAGESVQNSVYLEFVAQMALNTELLRSACATCVPMQNKLLRRHFDRKHGKNKYYGQG
ncbi:MAG: L-ribulose-5-phosphate 4-epimerase AraD [Ruminococcaceae bacterium]|nr:L-ribulose-5-phosphate 4-epimerase AraD [Oscillospiraceae bacterium]